MHTTQIYTLSHPTTGYIRYVGKSNNISNRYRLHISKKELTKKACWIASLKSQGLEPVIEIVDVVAISEWEFWELHWISLFKSWGYILYNGDNGGLGSSRLSEETKRKISNKQIGIAAKFNWVKFSQYSLTGAFIKTYNSCKEAALAVNLCHGNISRAAGNGSTAGGFKWKRENKYQEQIKKKRFCHKSKLVLDNETGIFYDSAKEASTVSRFSPSYLRNMLNGTVENITSFIYV